jgi:uncharacterized protein DUF6893
MKDIKISPTVQLAALGALGLAVAAGVAANMPELQRYLKVRKM